MTHLQVAKALKINVKNILSYAGVEYATHPRFEPLAMGGNYETFFQTIGVPAVQIKMVEKNLPNANIAHYHSAQHRLNAVPFCDKRVAVVLFLGYFGV